MHRAKYKESDKPKVENLLNSFTNVDNVVRVEGYNMRIIQLITRLTEMIYPHN